MAMRQIELLQAVFVHMGQEAARIVDLLAVVRDALSMGDFFP
jgi:hypothetical protein